MEQNMAFDKEITDICDGLTRLFDVEKLIVFGVKRSESTKNITDLDICVIADYDYNKNDFLKRAYLEIDSDIPFDIFLYTPTEWNNLIKKSESFASRIDRKGCIVYEKKQLP